MQQTLRKTLVFRFVLATLLLLVSPVASQADNAGLLGIRLGVHPDKTRIVLDVTATSQYELSFLSNPNRLVIDMPNTAWRVPADRLPAPGGIVQGFKPGATGTGGTRLEVLLNGPARISLADTLLATESAPARLFVDLVPASSVAAETVKVGQAPSAEENQVAPPPAVAVEPPPQPAAPKAPEPVAIEPVAPLPVTVAQTPAESMLAEPAAPTFSKVELPVPPVKPPQAGTPAVAMAAMTLPVPMPPPAKPEAPGGRKWVVALDPGHGGKDPGTIGVAGNAEKDITLKMARELKEKLESTGRYQVFLTRDGDELVALRDRTERARIAKADLFISLHADHIEQADLRGASVYTLSETASDTEAAALAARENKEDLITGVDLSSQSAVVASILIDLAQRETKNLSARFASMLSEELAHRTLMLRNAHRFAGFVVLKAPDVPSVLVELGYLSNKEDEQALASAEHRARLCEAMAKAIERYFAWQRSVKQI